MIAKRYTLCHRRRSAWRRAWPTACVFALSACQDAPADAVRALENSPTGKARDERLQDALAGRDSMLASDSALARWVLPNALAEISGLALTRDGRLLVHGDERGQVWEVDYRRGILVKRFSLATDEGVAKADFEGIAVVGDVVWMLAANGRLFEFKEGADGEKVAFRMHDPGLKKLCEFEGLAYDAAMNALVLACKNIYAKADRHSVVLYRWSLGEDVSERLTRLAVPVARVAGANGWTALQISDITVDPDNGNYVLIASKEKALITMTPTGAPVSAGPLPGDHDQPEGVAVVRNSLLLVSDEAAKGPAVLTLYRWPSIMD